MFQPMFSLVLKGVLSAMLKHLDSYIWFPQRKDFAHVKAEFHDLVLTPHVVRAITGTHLALIPLHDNEEGYSNRENYHSINVQVVCLVDCYISQVCARYPGSVHDAFIMRNSTIPKLMTRLYPKRAWLGFCIPKLFLVVETSEEPNYARGRPFQRGTWKNRCVMEQSFGLLKARFRAIDKTGGALLYSPMKLCKFIVACCMPHNLALRRNIPYISDEGELAVPPGEPPEMPSEDDRYEDGGEDMRADLINQYFT
ncbi:putative nuclease HARBI1 [Pleurodeles waltl]|uniref:putative nuclease HARBI1 n=1 Tax=Pleurodeles waltl TaxID=8319 RepID=UPI0037097357